MESTGKETIANRDGQAEVLAGTECVAANRKYWLRVKNYSRRAMCRMKWMMMIYVNDWGV